jgi:hypothetical protein
MWWLLRFSPDLRFDWGFMLFSRWSCWWKKEDRFSTINLTEFFFLQYNVYGLLLGTGCWFKIWYYVPSNFSRIILVCNFLNLLKKSKDDKNKDWRRWLSFSFHVFSFFFNSPTKIAAVQNQPIILCQNLPLFCGRLSRR